MRLLVLGRGKTGSLVAEVAGERGHSVTVLGQPRSPDHAELAQALATGCDAVIDFTTPEAVAGNLEVCLAASVRIVVGTTGWYAHLPALSTLAQRHDASLLYGTNFSLGVQIFFRAAQQLAHAAPAACFTIEEKHHVTKKDAPSGTALTLRELVAAASQQDAAKIPITSIREGDAAGLHVLTLTQGVDRVRLAHEASSRRGFAEGAVRAAEWLAEQTRPGVWNFAEIAAQLA